MTAVRKSNFGQMCRGRGTYLIPGGGHLLGEYVREPKRGQMCGGHDTYLISAGGHLLGEDMGSQEGASQQAQLRVERKGHGNPYRDDHEKAFLIDVLGSLCPSLTF